MANDKKSKRFFPADPDKKIASVAPMAQPMPKSETHKPTFSPMLQGTGSNRLSQISTRTTSPDVDAITGVATISAEDFKVFIEGYQNLSGGLRVSTHKLLDVCAINLTRQNDFRGEGELQTAVMIPLEDYMRLCGIPLTKPSKDKTRRRVQEDLEALYSVSIEWREKSGKSVKDYAKMRIVSAQGIKSGMIHVGFSPEFAKYLTNAYIMQYPIALLKVDERNPNSYHIGRKLLLHFSMDNNQKKGTANIVGVRALLSACPDIPDYEDVMASDRHTDRRIRTPLEDALNALDFITWEYVNSKSAPLADGQILNTTFDEFRELYVRFTVKNYPPIVEKGFQEDRQIDEI